MFPDLKGHTTVFVAFLAATAISLVITKLSIGISWRLGLVDQPDHVRKKHSRATPQLGGPALFLGFCLPMVGLMLFPEWSDFSEVLLSPDLRMKVIGLFLGGALVLGLGLVDDVHSIRPAYKLAGQVAIAGLIYFFDYQINAMSNPFGDPIQFGVFALPITILWFVGCMNVINLLDGLDGLATGVSLLVSLTLFMVSLSFGNLAGELTMACLSGAAFGFLFFNYPPAKIFLGDSGSLLLGFLIAATSVIGTSRKAEAAVALLIPVVALGLPIIDTSLSIVRRWYRKVPVSMADHQHIHHTLVSMGFSKKGAVILLYFISIIMGGGALVLTLGRSEVVLLILVMLLIMAIAGGRLFSGLHLRDMISRWKSGKISNQLSRHALEAIYQRTLLLEEVADFDALWTVTAAIFSEIRLSHAELSLTGDPHGIRKWQEGARGEVHGERIGFWSMTLQLKEQQMPVGLLSVQADIDAEAFDTQSLTGLIDHLGPALVRCRARIGEPLPQVGGDPPS